MTLSDTFTKLMDSARKIQGRTDKLSIADLLSMLSAIADLKVGDEQWASDCNNNRGIGIYFCHEGVKNKPSSNDGYLLNITPDKNGWNNTSTVAQFFLDRQNTSIYSRSMRADMIWSAWKQVGGGS